MSWYCLLRMFDHTLLNFYLFICFVTEAAYVSPESVEKIKGTSFSSLSHEHQQQPLSLSSRISNLTSVLDSRDLDCKDEGIFENYSVLKLA